MKEKYYLGIEFGSTRVKAILIDTFGTVVSAGIEEWESYIDENGYWTYNEADIWDIFLKSVDKVFSNIDLSINDVTTMGISGMMHGYIAIDKAGNLLTPFRTWRNNNTEVASRKLRELFEYNIPARWTVAHLYQAILDKEVHLENLNYITTLAGYIHYKLTGDKVVGIGEASGIFPINIETQNYNETMLDKFQNELNKMNLNLNIKDLLPKVEKSQTYIGKINRFAKEKLGVDIDNKINIIPPEGDAQTGMIATNTILPGQVSISVGTSIFANVVMEQDLSNFHEAIDIVYTPNGYPVAMVHVNNGTSEVNAWIKFVKDLLKIFGIDIETDQIYREIFNLINVSNPDDAIISIGYHSGENITQFNNPSLVINRKSGLGLTTENLFRSILFSTFTTLKMGLDILKQRVKLNVNKVVAHGGIFKTPETPLKILSAAINEPVSMMKNSDNGGAWGMAILAAYSDVMDDYSLDEYLCKTIFLDTSLITVNSNILEKKAFNQYSDEFAKMLPYFRNISEINNGENYE